ncbi:MAG: hypothetical protein JEY94_18100 [Melioribacteraceae bacterium]|nr:hypothetical protein [Melioribacteraceae bacterium]
MRNLAAQTFITSVSDFEMSQYQLLSYLTKYKTDLKKFKLYPSLTELIELSSMLEEIIDQKIALEKDFPRAIIKTDLADRLDLMDEFNLNEYELEKMMEFVDWALPQVRETINEGKAVYDFVEENMTLEDIGMLDDYKEGYFIIPELESDLMHIYRFEVSINEEDDSIRSLKTQITESFSSLDYEGLSLEMLKLKLLQTYPEFSKSVTLLLDTDVDLPYKETVLPIAKRKLIRKIAV